MRSRKWNFQARPSPTHAHGVQELSREGTALVTDAGYFPTEAEAIDWAADRRWQRYELKRTVGV